MLSLEKIKRYAEAEGFDLCGAARCRTMDEHAPHFDRWLRAGYHGGMDYMQRKLDLRLNPAGLVEGAQTVIVCAVSYNFGMSRAVERAAEAGAPRIASYALGTDYHAVIKVMLGRLWNRLKEDDPQMQGRCFVDTAPLLEKAWAVEAGLGWAGKNTLLVTPHHGSFVLLGEIVTTAVSDAYDAPFSRNLCGACTRCIDACPTDAILAPRVMDTRRCISRLTVEKIRTDEGGQPDPAYGAEVDLHGWIFGCDACLSACPYNKKALPGSCPGLKPTVDPAALTRDFWMGLTEEEFILKFGATPLTRCGLERIKRQIEA